MHLVAGTSLKNGQYILNHILDQQGIGWTYRATQTDLNQTVLIKTLNPTLRSHPQFNQIRQDFVTRSHTLGRLRHPSLVKVFDIFQDQDIPFVVMEYLQGISLNDWMNDRPRSEAEVIQFLRQMTQVLSYLQQHNYCHGNLKPRNIIYRSESESKPKSNPESKSTPSTVVLVGFAPSLVLSEMIARRNPYSAPELRTGRVDNKSDLYSLSGLLYYCLTQHPPLDGGSQSDRLPLLSLLKPGAQRLLRSGTQLNPDDRPINADRWLAQLSKSQPAIPKASAITQIQGPIEPQRQDPQPIPKPVSEAPTYLQDPDSPLPRSSSTLPTAASTQVQTPQTSIQPPAQTPEQSPQQYGIPVDRAKTIRPEVALPENLPRYQTTPLMVSNANLSSNANSDADLAESMISGRISGRASGRVAMKRSPVEESYRGAKYIKPGGLLPKLRTVQIIGAIGATLGLIFGIVLRFQASRRPGASFFHTGQSFPPREWKGTVSPNETDNKDVFVEPNSAPPASESVEPQTTPGKPAEPSSKFPTRAEPFSPADAIVPVENAESPEPNKEASKEGAKPNASKSP